MKPDFKNCLDQKKLFRSEAAKALVDKEFQSAVDDLAEAERSLDQKRYKWATIQAYYAIFHGARALLYSRGYRERSHACVVAGLEQLFGEAKQLDLKWVRALINAMSLREDADYSNAYSPEGAEISLKNAQGFIQVAENLLKGTKQP